MANIQIGIDATQATAATQQFVELLKQTTSVMGDFTVKTLAFNDAGQLTTGTIEQLNNTGKRLTSTFDTTGQSAVLVGQKLTEAGRAGAAAGQAVFVSWQQLARIFEVQIFRRLVTEITNAFQAGIQAAVQYQIQLRQVANLAGQGGGDLTNFRNQIRSMSEQFGTPIGDVLTSSQVALTQQLGRTTQGFEVLNQAMTLSQATGLQLDTTTRLITTTLDAFHLSADQASRVSDVLFSTAQRTRGGMENLGISIGRISQVAKELRIPFEEIVALYQTIEAQGGRPTEAFSLLNVALGRLINPTREVQQVLNSIGISSAQAGIQALGTAGFLDRFTGAIERVPEALREMGGSTRGIRADLSITGDSVNIFRQRLEALNQTAGEVGAAARRTEDTPAAQIRRQVEEIKNVFTQDIGNAVIKIVNDIVQAMGGARIAVEALIISVATLVISFTALRFAPPIFNAVDIAISAVTRQARESVGVISAMGGVFTTAFAIGLLIFESQRIKLLQIKEETRRTIEEIQRLTERANALILTQSQNRQREFSDRARLFFEPALKAASEGVTRATEFRDRMVQQQAEIAGAFKIQVETFLDTLRTGINNVRENIREIQADIDKSTKAVGQFRQQVNASQFQTRLQFTTFPQANIDLLRTRISTIQQEINASLVSGDRLAIQSAAEKFTELNNLENEFARASLDRQREGIIARGGGETVFDPVTLQRVRLITLDMTEITRRQNDLIQQRVVFESRRMSLLQQEKAAEEEKERRLRNTLRTFDTLLKIAEQFKIFNEQGKLLPQFEAAERAAPGGGERAALRQFDELAARIRAAAVAQGQEIGPINELLEQRRNNLIDQIRASRQLTAANVAQAEVQGRLRDMVAEQARLEGRIVQERRDANSALVRVGTEVANISGTLNQNIATTVQALSSGATRFQVGFVAGFRTMLAELATAQQQATTSPTTENLQRVQRALTAVRAESARLATAPGFRNLSQEAQDYFNRLNEVDPNRSSIAYINRLLTETGIGASRTQERLDELNRELGGPARLTTSFNDIRPAAENAGQAMTTALTNANANAQTLNGNLDSTLQHFRSLAGIQGSGFTLPNLATGGPVSDLGRPDNKHLLAWVGVDEFVMNASSTKKFFTQLVAMNSGHQPRSFAQGGPVTNVGDIHLNLSSSGSKDADLREIGRGLRREIRRGTIRF